MGKLYDDDSGTKIVLDAGCNISHASLIEIIWRSPNRKVGKWKAILEGHTAVSYIVRKEDLNIPGSWQLQLQVVLGSWRGHGEIVTLPVYKSLSSE